MTTTYQLSDLREYCRKRIVVAESGCWEWVGVLAPSGYGAVWSPWRTATVPAHREVYQQMVGDIPKGLVLDHLCGVRHCVNPAHLEPVTYAENSRRGRNHNREKTHCPQGHPYSGDNLYEAVASRMCRTCIREHNLRAAEKWRAARAAS
jgi:hypothetical protein